MALSGFSSGATNFLRCSSGIITAAPLTMACWMKCSDVTTNQQLMGLYNSASNGLNRFEIDIIGGTGRLVISDGTTSTVVQKSGLVVDTWCHVAAVFTSPTSYNIYTNGLAGTAGTTSRTPSGINRASIGIHDNASATKKPFLGTMAEVSYWNAALDAAEVSALAAGVPAALVRPQNLVAYPPLIRDPIDLKGNTFAIQGSLSAADHCRIYGVAA